MKTMRIMTFGLTLLCSLTGLAHDTPPLGNLSCNPDEPGMEGTVTIYDRGHGPVKPGDYFSLTKDSTGLWTIEGSFNKKYVKTQMKGKCVADTYVIYGEQGLTCNDGSSHCPGYIRNAKICKHFDEVVAWCEENYPNKNFEQCVQTFKKKMTYTYVSFGARGDGVDGCQTPPMQPNANEKHAKEKTNPGHSHGGGDLDR